MKFFTANAVLVLLGALSMVRSQDQCPNGTMAACYCSSSETSDNCDVTKRITQTAQVNATECAAYCTSECGQGAGSAFSCSLTGDQAPNPCNDASTCKCACNEQFSTPSPIQWSQQCSAFCSREEICGAGAGTSFSCKSAAPAHYLVMAALAAATSFAFISGM